MKPQVQLKACSLQVDSLRVRRLRRARLWAVAVLVTASLLAPTAASAGTLTSATFTTLGTGYATTSAQNTRYDWNYTTATSSTLTRVSQTVPAGTNTYGARYLALNGVSGNYVSTPDSTANSISGNIDIRLRVALATYTGSVQRLASKWTFGGSQLTWALDVNSAGQLLFDFSGDGSSQFNDTSNAALTTAAGANQWVRVTEQPNNGSNHVTTFYTSTDGTNWTMLGSALLGSTLSLFDSNAAIDVGASDGGAYGNSKSRYSFMSLSNTISGTTSSPSMCASTGVVACFSPNDYTSGTTFTSSSPQAETWTINRSGTNLPADIASDLSVSNVSGLPSGGTASYRMIDGAAVYVLPSAMSIASGVVCSLGLTGFTNTAIAGSYTSTITTYDNSATPVAVDTATTGTLIFAPMSSQSNTYVTVDPTFAIVLANQASACNGESNFVSGAGSSTAINFGHLGAGVNASGGQALSVVSNAGGGFVVYIRGTQATQNLRGSIRNWADASGTYASPAVLGAGEAFGYTYKDSTTSSSVTNPASAKFAALTATNQAVMGSTSSASGSSCVSFDAQSAAATPAGSYSATIIYTAIPTF